MHSLGTRALLSAMLRSKATEHTGTARAAFTLAASHVEAGQNIPSDVRAIIDRACSFTQDKYGH